MTSLAAAVLSECPFRSAISDVLQILFESFRRLFEGLGLGSGNLSWKARRRLLIGFLAFAWVVLCAAVAYAALKLNKFIIAFTPIGIPVGYSLLQEPDHTPQKYKLPQLAAWAFLFITLTIILSTCFDSLTFILLYVTGVLGVGFLCLMFGKMSRSMKDTGEIDAMAWLLITEPPQYPATLFKKVGQKTVFDSITSDYYQPTLGLYYQPRPGHYYRPRLLQSLMPHLTHLITSYHAPKNDTHPTSSSKLSKTELKGEKSGDVLKSLPTSLGVVDNDKGHIDEDLKNVEIYTACLARLSDFTDSEGSFWCLWEDARQHPKLEQPLVDKLEWFVIHSQGGLKSAATKVLKNYNLDMKGNPAVNSRASQEEQGHLKLYPATDVEPAHSSEEVKGVKREIGMC